ncbi:hypothetical protein PHISCL_04837 [Aspergillus sclerotialis]|uniref:Uncharacterized protein n=1 Tax=Aspergillus sclerotialis TaxID=2070753 RepID=A0A3A2ZHW2_9EURO|nr:hypothetical protein PHISCL_04837 [Aspergillus sclerotialis]
MYKPAAKENLEKRTTRSRSPPSEEQDMPSNDETQQEQSISNIDRDIMGVTSKGRPPRISRRKRSEYANRSWNRGPDHKRIGRTGSKHRSTTGH